MIDIPNDISLVKNGVRLERLNASHVDDLALACQDGKLWQLVYTSTPTAESVMDYIHLAENTANRIAFAVIDEHSQRAIGTTSFHDILPNCKRLEIGYTWYAGRYQRTQVNTICKLLLLTYAFEVLGYHTVGFRTDVLNLRSQQAINRLGATFDGIILGNRLNKDGQISDTLMYSITHGAWADIKEQLIQKLSLYGIH